MLYFRAKYIAEAFEMPNLVREINNKYKKQMYLTFEGALKVLYSSRSGSTLEIRNFVHNDPKNLADAEMDLKSFFQDIEMPINYESYKELVAINPKHENKFKSNLNILTRSLPVQLPN